MTPENAPKKSIATFLPWTVAGGALLVYLLTLNHWVSIASVISTAKITGWDWRPTTSAPLWFALTWPVRMLPAAWQPIALNGLSALAAALTLALLARSIRLLPHDRTRDQRQRETGEHALLSLPTAWLPPLAAAIIFGLQLSFWEHATAATGEMLDLLIFACVIRCLLEFRISRKEKWLSQLALVYGLGVTNNWAMIGYFPLFLIALVWIKGRDFLQFGFVARMIGCGTLGLLLYLLLPVVNAVSDHAGGTFFQMLRSNLGSQKMMTWNNPFIRSGDLRLEFFALALGSILPVVLIGVRWPSFQKDTSPATQTIVTFMVRFLHMLFLGFSLWIFFDPEFSGRALGRGFIPFLSFYYLAALTTGYLMGYVLLVFGRAVVKSRHRSKSRQFTKVVPVLIWIAAVAIPGGLLWKNWGAIRATNGPQLRQFANRLVQSLPEKDAVILSDDPLRIFLLQAAYAQTGRPPENLLLETTSLSYASYHKAIDARFPSFHDDLFKADALPEYVNSVTILTLLGRLREKHPLYYLHPSFGYFFEFFYSRPHGLTQELKLYEKSTLAPPPLTPEEVAENQNFWTDFQKTSLAEITPFLKKSTDMAWLGQNYSQALNTWGVALQKRNRLPEAKEHFATAFTLNPDNVAALINEQFNAQLQKGGEVIGIESNQEIDKKLGQHRGWEIAMKYCGDFDELEVCHRLGQIFTVGNNLRQGTAYYNRVLELSPGYQLARLGLIENYVDLGFPDQALAQIQIARQHAEKNPLTEEIDLRLAGLEAKTYAAKGDRQVAEDILLLLQSKRPNDPRIANVLLQFYMQIQRYEDALTIIDAQLAQNPKDLTALISQGALFIQLKQFAQAVEAMSRYLELEPNAPDALLNRAIAQLQAGKWDAARNDYLTLEKLLPQKLYAVYYGLGEIAFQTKQKEEAIKYYREYLEAAPKGTKEYKEIAERMNELQGVKSPSA